MLRTSSPEHFRKLRLQAARNRAVNDKVFVAVCPLARTNAAYLAPSDRQFIANREKRAKATQERVMKEFASRHPAAIAVTSKTMANQITEQSRRFYHTTRMAAWRATRFKSSPLDAKQGDSGKIRGIYYTDFKDRIHTIGDKEMESIVGAPPLISTYQLKPICLKGRTPLYDDSSRGKRSLKEEDEEDKDEKEAAGHRKKKQVKKQQQHRRKVKLPPIKTGPRESTKKDNLYESTVCSWCARDAEEKAAVVKLCQKVAGFWQPSKDAMVQTEKGQVIVDDLFLPDLETPVTWDWADLPQVSVSSVSTPSSSYEEDATPRPRWRRGRLRPVPVDKPEKEPVELEEPPLPPTPPSLPPTPDPELTTMEEIWEVVRQQKPGMPHPVHTMSASSFSSWCQEICARIRQLERAVTQAVKDQPRRREVPRIVFKPQPLETYPQWVPEPFHTVHSMSSLSLERWCEKVTARIELLEQKLPPVTLAGRKSLNRKAAKELRSGQRQRRKSPRVQQTADGELTLTAAEKSEMDSGRLHTVHSMSSVSLNEWCRSVRDRIRHLETSLSSAYETTGQSVLAGEDSVSQLDLVRPPKAEKETGRPSTPAQATFEDRSAAVDCFVMDVGPVLRPYFPRTVESMTADSMDEWCQDVEDMAEGRSKRERPKYEPKPACEDTGYGADTQRGQTEVIQMTEARKYSEEPPAVMKVQETERELPKQTEVHETERELPKQTEVQETERELPKQTEVQETERELPKQTEVPETERELPKQTEVPETERELPKQTEVQETERELPKQTEVQETERELPKQTEVQETEKELPKQTEVQETERELPKQTEVQETERELPKQTEVQETERELPKQTEVQETERELPKQTEVHETERELPKQTEVQETERELPKQTEVQETERELPKQTEVPETERELPKQTEVQETERENPEQRIDAEEVGDAERECTTEAYEAQEMEGKYSEKVIEGEIIEDIEREHSEQVTEVQESEIEYQEQTVEVEERVTTYKWDEEEQETETEIVHELDEYPGQATAIEEVQGTETEYSEKATEVEEVNVTEMEIDYEEQVKDGQDVQEMENEFSEQVIEGQEVQEKENEYTDLLIEVQEVRELERECSKEAIQFQEIQDSTPHETGGTCEALLTEVVEVSAAHYEHLQEITEFPEMEVGKTKYVEPSTNVTSGDYCMQEATDSVPGPEEPSATVAGNQLEPDYSSSMDTGSAQPSVVSASADDEASDSEDMHSSKRHKVFRSHKRYVNVQAPVDSESSSEPAIEDFSERERLRPNIVDEWSSPEPHKVESQDSTEPFTKTAAAEMFEVTYSTDSKDDLREFFPSLIKIQEKGQTPAEFLQHPPEPAEILEQTPTSSMDKTEFDTLTTQPEPQEKVSEGTEGEGKVSSSSEESDEEFVRFFKEDDRDFCSVCDWPVLPPHLRADKVEFSVLSPVDETKKDKPEASCSPTPKQPEASAKIPEEFPLTTDKPEPAATTQPEFQTKELTGSEGSLTSEKSNADYLPFFKEGDREFCSACDWPVLPPHLRDGKAEISVLSPVDETKKEKPEASCSPTPKQPEASAKIPEEFPLTTDKPEPAATTQPEFQTKELTGSEGSLTSEESNADYLPFFKEDDREFCSACDWPVLPPHLRDGKAEISVLSPADETKKDKPEASCSPTPKQPEVSGKVPEEFPLTTDKPEPAATTQPEFQTKELTGSEGSLTSEESNADYLPFLKEDDREFCSACDWPVLPPHLRDGKAEIYILSPADETKKDKPEASCSPTPKQPEVSGKVPEEFPLTTDKPEPAATTQPEFQTKELTGSEGSLTSEKSNADYLPFFKEDDREFCSACDWPVLPPHLRDGKAEISVLSPVDETKKDKPEASCSPTPKQPETSAKIPEEFPLTTDKPEPAATTQPEFQTKELTGSEGSLTSEESNADYLPFLKEDDREFCSACDWPVLPPHLRDGKAEIYILSPADETKKDKPEASCSPTPKQPEVSGKIPEEFPLTTDKPEPAATTQPEFQTKELTGSEGSLTSEKSNADYLPFFKEDREFRSVCEWPVVKAYKPQASVFPSTGEEETGQREKISVFPASTRKDLPQTSEFLPTEDVKIEEPAVSYLPTVQSSVPEEQPEQIVTAKESVLEASAEADELQTSEFLPTEDVQIEEADVSYLPTVQSSVPEEQPEQIVTAKESVLEASAEADELQTSEFLPTEDVKIEEADVSYLPTFQSSVPEEQPEQIVTAKESVLEASAEADELQTSEFLPTEDVKTEEADVSDLPAAQSSVPEKQPEQIVTAKESYPITFHLFRKDSDQEFCSVCEWPVLPASAKADLPQTSQTSPIDEKQSKEAAASYLPSSQDVSEEHKGIAKKPYATTFHLFPKDNDREFRSVCEWPVLRRLSTPGKVSVAGSLLEEDSKSDKPADSFSRPPPDIGRAPPPSIDTGLITSTDKQTIQHPSRKISVNDIQSDVDIFSIVGKEMALELGLPDISETELGSRGEQQDRGVCRDDSNTLSPSERADYFYRLQQQYQLPADRLVDDVSLFTRTEDKAVFQDQQSCLCPSCQSSAKSPSDKSVELFRADKQKPEDTEQLASVENSLSTSTDKQTIPNVSMKISLKHIASDVDIFSIVGKEMALELGLPDISETELHSRGEQQDRGVCRDDSNTLSPSERADYFYRLQQQYQLPADRLVDDVSLFTRTEDKAAFQDQHPYPCPSCQSSVKSPSDESAKSDTPLIEIDETMPVSSDRINAGVGQNILLAEASSLSTCSDPATSAFPDMTTQPSPSLNKEQELDSPLLGDKKNLVSGQKLPSALPSTLEANKEKPVVASLPTSQDYVTERQVKQVVTDERGCTTTFHLFHKDSDREFCSVCEWPIIPTLSREEKAQVSKFSLTEDVKIEEPAVSYLPTVQSSVPEEQPEQIVTAKESVLEASAKADELQTSEFLPTEDVQIEEADVSYLPTVQSSVPEKQPEQIVTAKESVLEASAEADELQTSEFLPTEDVQIEEADVIYLPTVQSSVLEKQPEQIVTAKESYPITFHLFRKDSDQEFCSVCEWPVLPASAKTDEIQDSELSQTDDAKVDFVSPTITAKKPADYLDIAGPSDVNAVQPETIEPVASLPSMPPAVDVSHPQSETSPSVKQPPQELINYSSTCSWAVNPSFRSKMQKKNKNDKKDKRDKF